MPKRLTPEARLARYWHRRLPAQEWVDFDIFQGGKPRDPKVEIRSPYWIFNAATGDAGGDHVLATVAVVKSELAHLIAKGWPLGFAEYHLAIAFGYLLADGIPYEEFYRKRWHETATRRGYGPAPKAPRKEAAT